MAATISTIYVTVEMALYFGEKAYLEKVYSRGLC
jgi:hypothetical protein